jgi:RND family efflux transporter MFP subunit
MLTKRTSARLLIPGLCALMLLSACREEAETGTPELRPVRSIVVAETDTVETLTLTGTVEAQVEVDLGFRIGGRLMERLVGVGDTITPGQPIARLDPSDEENGLRAAEAQLSAATAQLTEAQTTFDRQRQLFDRDVVSRAALDRAEQVLSSARGSVDAAQAQVGIAQRRLNDTLLLADAGGIVTATGAEAGEVVTAGRRIVRVAREQGVDAVFDVPAASVAVVPPDPEVTVTLAMNRGVTATGRVREVAPRADVATGTIRVRVGLIDPPAEMRLGSTVNGSVTFGGGDGIEIPASALTSADGKPAVWVVDPATNTVALRQVVVGRFAPATVAIDEGLEIGERIVTAGVQALLPGQEVRLLGEGS